MTSFLDKLNLQPQERRWVFGIIVAVILVLNYVLIWPYFAQWSVVRKQIDENRVKLRTYTTEIDRDAKPISGYQAILKKHEQKAPAIASDRGNVQLQQTVMAMTTSEFTPSAYNPEKIATQTNSFFEEQGISIPVVCEEKPLVDFLYKAGSDASMIRVRSLNVTVADNYRYKLSAKISLSATYQKAEEKKPEAPAKPAESKPGMSKPGTAASKPAVVPASGAPKAPATATQPAKPKK